MNDFLAFVVGILIFVPCAIYGWSAITRDRATDAEQEPQRQDLDVQQESPTWTVEQTFTQKVTNVALTWTKKAVGINVAPRALPPTGTDGDTQPSGADPDPDDTEDLPGWEEAEVVRPDPPLAPPKPIARILRTALPWLRPTLDDDPPELPAARATRPDVHVDVDRDEAPSTDGIPIPATVPAQVVTGPPMTVDPDPVALEGVDMSQAPLVPAGDGTVARVPTISQLRIALATGGFSRLKAWLRAFKKASGNTRDQANALHADALVIARRARTAHVMALQAFQAVQADKLDRQTINRVWQMLERTQAEAAAAANVTRWTAALVVAAGGAQPAVAAALSTLQRNHGGTATAIQASPVDPVPNLDWYRH